MPRMNGTGPEGKGSRTGRGLGGCKKNPNNKEIPGKGKGLGKGRKSGRGAGKGNRFQSGS